MRRIPLLLTVIGIVGATGYLLRDRVGASIATWGATTSEAAEPLPGDEVVPDAQYVSTHAVTIDVPPERVWPWVVQLGQGRGGLYSYDRLENLLGLDIHSLDHIDPDLQSLAPGDRVRLTPEGMQPELAYAVLRVEPPHLLLLGPHGSKAETLAAGMPWSTWAFVPRSADHGGTRLLVRFRSQFEPTVLGTLTNKVALAPIHLLMERKMLLGIKERAETAQLSNISRH